MANPINTLIFGVEPGAILQLRLLSPLSRLQQEGVLEYKFINYTKIGSFAYKDFEAYDLIIFQRVYHPEMLELLHAAKRRGKRTIYEIDDNLLEIPLQHPMSDQFTPARNRQCIIEFIQQVDHVTVTTEPLLHDLSQYNPKITILPNYLDERIFPEMEPRPPHRGPIRIGYAAGWTHDDDFRQVLPAVKRLQEEYAGNIRFVFFIYIPEELKGNPNVEQIGGAEYVSGYSQLLATAQLDIGLAPLRFNRFNECKSDVKFLEYGSRRIAGVYSGIMPYTKAVQGGETGILVETEDTDLWYDKIKSLIDNRAEREKIQQQAYDYVMGERTLGSNSHRWYDLYCDILAESKETGARVKGPDIDPDRIPEREKPLAAALKRKSEEATKLVNQGDLDTGGTLYREILQEDPSMVEAVYGLGLIAHLKGDLGEARNLYQRAVSFDKEWKPVQHSLALLDIAEGKPEAAQLRLAKILQQDPNDLDSRRLLGQSFLEAEQFDEGVGILMGILKDNPNDWQTHFLLAVLYAEVDRQEDVKRHLAAVLAANPDHAEAREMLQAMTKEK